MNEDAKNKVCVCRAANSKPLAGIKEYVYGEEGIADIFGHEVVFILTGELHIVIRNTKANKNLIAGDFVFIAAGTILSYRALTDTTLLYTRVVDVTRECELYRMQKSIDLISEQAMQGGYALSANDRIKLFTQSMVASVEDGIKCRNYMNAKGAEFIYLLHSHYSAEECANFFATISSSDIVFSEFVRKNYRKHRTAQELAPLFRNMTPQSFARKFRQVFGDNPSDWIERERRQRIYIEICDSHKSLKEIADEYYFYDVSNLSRYCKREYNLTAKQIRDKLKR